MRKPFTMLLRGRTIADLRSRSAPTVSFREQGRIHPRFYLKTTEDVLILRCWASRPEWGWSLKAALHPHEQGIRIEGRIRCRNEVASIGLFSLLAAVNAALAAAGVFSDQPRAGFPLGGAILFLAVSALLIRRRRAAMHERNALARGYLASL